MKQRILGFDLARSYAIFGMFIVNFNFSFGSLTDSSPFGKFLNLFVGNSTSIFIILAGIGLALMIKNLEPSLEERKKLKSTIFKRSWFLFALGLLLYNWWPGDILHFYGGYMHIATFLLFIPKKYYLWIAVLVIVVYHILLFIIPVGTSWDFTTTQYLDFWTMKGFIRNTFYNGWNSIFPWFAYFAIGMWLGHLNWENREVKRKLFLISLSVFLISQCIRFYFKLNPTNEATMQYIFSEYMPPYLPYMLITSSFAIIVLSICMFISTRFNNNKILTFLANPGKMSLSLYIGHLTIGMFVLSQLTGQPYSGYWNTVKPSSPLYLFVYSVCFFTLSLILSWLWLKKFGIGPIEFLMRKISR